MVLNLLHLFRMAMSHVFVATLFPCPLLNLRNVHVKCHDDFYAPVMLLRPHVTYCVTVSVLGV